MGVLRTLMEFKMTTEGKEVQKEGGFFFTPSRGSQLGSVTSPAFGNFWYHLPWVAKFCLHIVAAMVWVPCRAFAIVYRIGKRTFGTLQ